MNFRSEDPVTEEREEKGSGKQEGLDEASRIQKLSEAQRQPRTSQPGICRRAPPTGNFGVTSLKTNWKARKAATHHCLASHKTGSFSAAFE